jgi:hypothetical protein
LSFGARSLSFQRDRWAVKPAIWTVEGEDLRGLRSHRRANMAAMAGLVAWIRVVLGGGRPLPHDQLNEARRHEVDAFAYQQADLLREGKVTRAEAVDAIAERFPALGREQAARALGRGL